MLRVDRRPKDKAEQMILNNYNAILEIRDLKTEKSDFGNALSSS